jgi:hypothetical protein
MHYPLFDCDGIRCGELVNYLREKYPTTPYIAYDTAHGCHAILLSPMPIFEMLQTVCLCPYTDKVHLSMGVKRGYLYLETKFMPKQFHKVVVQYMTPMRIER